MDKKRIDASIKAPTIMRNLSYNNGTRKWENRSEQGGKIGLCKMGQLQVCYSDAPMSRKTGTVLNI